MEYDWIIFLSDDFSENFKGLLSQGLKTQFDLLIEKKNAIDDYDFQMIIGIRDLDLRTENGNTFINVDFILPTSESLPVTIGWKEDKGKVASLNPVIDDSEFSFFWTSDLPLDRIKSFIK